jgi:hypothetical protein
MELSCKCGNETDYIEETITSFTTDAEGNREEKVREETRYFCRNCNEEAEIVED